MDSLVGYGSDEDNETERFGGQSSVGTSGRRRDDDTNYDDVNMDMSEGSRTLSQDSQAESEPELPPAEPAAAPRRSADDHRNSNESRNRERHRERDDRHSRRRESPRPRSDRDRDRDRGRDRDRRSPRRDDRTSSSSKSNDSRRGQPGDRPDDRHSDSKVPALMDLKPFGGEPPPGYDSRRANSRDSKDSRDSRDTKDSRDSRDAKDSRDSRDARDSRERRDSREIRDARDTRDAVSPRFVDRDRRDRDRDRERDRDRHSRRSEEKRSHDRERRPRSRSRGNYPPPHSLNDRRGSPPLGEYRPSSYKVNKKLEVMEKMGLQIKTPDGSMATAQELRAAAGPTPLAFCRATRALDQVQKRKLLWAGKGKEPQEAAKWSGAKFSQDADGRQASKFLRLMGIRDPAAATAAAPPVPDAGRQQEELFQAMQAQYDVARAATHTMRGVGLGFSRAQL